MSQTGKLMPNLDLNTTKILNLTVLQRMDPNIEEILITAAHVTFYEFNVDSSQWSRKDVEGSLFVVKRNAQPRFQFIVMNRRSTENLVENLLGDFEYEVQIPYLLYRNASQEVNGIWFYNSRECEEVANLFSRILSAYSKVPPKPKVSSGKSEFEELEAAPSMSIMEEPLEPSSTASANDTPEDSAFMNFFTMALNVGNNTTNAPITREHHQQQPSPTIPLFPSAVTVPSAPLANSEVPSFPISSSLNPVTRNDSSDLIGNKNMITNLVKPSLFISAATPSSSSALMMPPAAPAPTPLAAALQPPLNLQRPYGTPLLQPFPPPTPSPSLAHNPLAPSATPIISRDKIREALLKLVQEDQFVDMFYQALLKVHNS